MKHLAATIYLGLTLFLVLNIGGYAHGLVLRPNQNAERIFTDNIFLPSGSTIILNDPSGKVSGSNNLKRPPISSYKLSSVGFSSYKAFKFAINNELSLYLYFTKCFDIQLEGPDIIHPFNYFW